MATQPIFPTAPFVGIASLTAATPVATRANITGTTGLTKLTDTSANGLRIDQIQVAAKGTTVAGAVDIWMFDGTTSRYYDTIPISALTASTTVDPFKAAKSYSALSLPPTYQLFISETVAQDLNVFAPGGVY